MERWLLLLFPVFPTVQAQWIQTSAPSGGRADDLFFIGPDTGWVAGGGEGWIARTYDGGDTWQTVHTGEDYLRSIEFATPQLGFSGALQGPLLQTVDGGDTWQDITDRISPAPTGICGLNAPAPNVIYGVGSVTTPAFVIRSTDGGATWDYIDLSAHAQALIDVFFFDPDTGFVSGMASPDSLGGIILGTTDGGDTWSVVHTTGADHEYIWKLQTPDSVHVFGSIEALQNAPTRFVRTADRGATWSTDTISTTPYHLQVIGFLDPMHGWAGSEWLLETTDGGATWVPCCYLWYGYNRFQRVSPTVAYISGRGVFKYGDPTVGVGGVPVNEPRETVRVSPNPVADRAFVDVQVSARTYAEVELFSPDGRRVRSLHRGQLPAGPARFDLDTEGLAPGAYVVAMHTFLGVSNTTFIKP